MRLALFFLVFLSLQFFLVGFYLHKRVVKILFFKDFVLQKYVRNALFSILALGAFSHLLYRASTSQQGAPWMAHFQYVTFSCFAILGLLFGWSLVKDAIYFVVKYLFKSTFTQSPSGEHQNHPHRFLIRLTQVGVAAGFANAIWGLAGMWKGPQVIHVEVPIKTLPASIEGLKIAHITDVHVGNTIQKEYVEKIVSQVNALEPDMICLTGDAIDGTPDQLRPHLEPFKKLRSRLGSFFVTGNHEYYWGGENWIREFENLGFSVLTNDNRVVELNSIPISISGLPDRQGAQFFPEHVQDPEKAFRGTEKALLKLLLVHQPISINNLGKYDYNLALSGHTHAGQVFPVTLIIHLIQPYVKGLYPIEGERWLYVNQGTGYYGPPMRAGTVPEITLLKLTQSPGRG